MEKTKATRNQSRAFMLAAQRCNEARPLPSGNLQILFVPSLVCYAFSIEVGLKALALHENGAAPYGHDLKELVQTLSPDLQAMIVAETGHPNFFEPDLDLVHDAFDVWRYIYERPSAAIDADLGFLQRFAASVQKALVAMIP